MSIAMLKEDAVPAPNRTTNEQIVAAARGILDARGIEALTMQAVAKAAAACGVELPEPLA